MARALSRLLPSILLVITACSAGDGAAAGARNDTAQGFAAPPAARDTAQVREAVLRMEEELAQALVRGDSAPAQRILAVDYMGVTGGGHTETRAEAIAATRPDSAKSERVAVDAIQLDSTAVRVYGDAAVAQWRGTVRGKIGGKPFKRIYRNTDVFVWRDGRWQIVATHLSPIVEP